ncbi:glycosyltransferase [Weeksellaceae bacterium A-14]
MKNLLFITWDGPQTSYMEGLFMPIFSEISKKEKIQFHVIQFTWADQKKTEEVKKAAEKLGIRYTAFPVYKKPVASIGSFLTLFTSSQKIEKYIRENKIDIVMPRSTFPAFMVNKIRKSFEGKIIFDADGLPIEERVDFAGLKRNSFLYKFLKSAETKMLKKADAVITRSQKALDIHVQTIGEQHRPKFSVVFNGRDAEKFKFNEEWRRAARKELGVDDELLFVYAGSLGPQYCMDEMLEIFRISERAKFLILTGNPEFAEKHIPEDLRERIEVKKVPSDEVPYWLNAGDIAFGLRQPTYSMQGVAPIKLGEYLLCGLPVIASKGIGDSEEILINFEESYLYDHKSGIKDNLKEIMEFVENAKFADRNKIRKKALAYFSLEAAAESYIYVLRNI